MTAVALALGSNVGDREAHLTFAGKQLESILQSLRLSSFYETDPVDVAPQPRFLNAAATGETSLSARDLLNALLAIERQAGRQRPHPGAPRTLDLDLILFGDAMIREDGLHVPHPRFRARRFVLEPLAEIAGDWVDPVTGLSMEALLRKTENRK